MTQSVLLKIVKLQNMVLVRFFCKGCLIIITSLFITSCNPFAETELLVQTAKHLKNMGNEESSKKNNVYTVPHGYKLGKPYKVAGVKYFPQFDPKLIEEGIASWYGEPFHGRDTANGEIYDMNSLTAAHKTMPLPSTVRVTNLENGRKLLLRVNDRGPFVGGRIIDISRRGAQLLGFFRKGTARVKLEFIELAPLHERVNTVHIGRKENKNKARRTDGKITKEELVAIPSRPITKRDNIVLERLAEPIVVDEGTQVPNKKPTHSLLEVSGSNIGLKGMFVQVGAFKERGNAVALAQKLNLLSPSRFSRANVRGATLYRVRMGPINTLEEARILLQKINNAGYDRAHIIVVQ